MGFLPRSVPGLGPVAILSAATANGDGTDHALLGVTTDTGSGTWYWDVSTSCGLSPTAAQIKGGTVTGHVFNGNQAVSTSGVQSSNPTGPSAVTTYCAYYVQNTVGGDSNIIAAQSFTTPGTLTITIQTTAAFDAAQGGALKTAVLNTVNNVIQPCFVPAVNVTAVIKFDYASGGTDTAQTSPFPSSGWPYTTFVRPALLALPSKNSVQAALFANPPASEPTGINANYFFTSIQARALGLNDPPPALDSTTTFNSIYTFQTDAACTGPGTYCASGLTLHEISEALGREWGQDLGIGTQPGLAEFSSYTGAGVRAPASSTPSKYASIDGGLTNLMSPFFYTTTSPNVGDWTSAGLDNFAFTNPGPLTTFTARDIKIMSIEGWGLGHNCRISAGL